MYDYLKAPVRFSGEEPPDLSTRRLRITLQIDHECNRQDKRWGEERTLSPLLWHAVLSEEEGEVSKAVVAREPLGDLRKELIQVAAVCVQWVDAIDCGRVGLRDFEDPKDEGDAG